MKATTGVWLAAVVLAALSAGCATQAPAPDFQALVASPDRSEADRATDARRKPAQLLAFYDVRPGTGAAETKTLHRIEEVVVRREIEAAGFRFVAEGGFLRNPQDPRDAPVFKPRQPNDEFVLKFVKP